MANVTRRNWLQMSGVAPLAGSLFVLKGGGVTKAATPARFNKVTISPRERIREDHFPNVPLLTHDNRKVRFYDDLIKGKIVTLNYMYTSCKETCPLTTEHLVKVQQLLGNRVGKEIFMYSFTLDPDHDTPAALRTYMKTHRVGPGWTFLTGKYADLELLRHKLGFVDPDPKVDKDRANHIGSVEVGNEPLTLWRECASLLPPEWIVKEISWIAQLKDFRLNVWS